MTTAETAAPDTTAAAATTAGSTTTNAPPSADAFPVTIEHAYGSTVLEAPPERVATLGLQWTDVLLALDEEPDRLRQRGARR